MSTDTTTSTTTPSAITTTMRLHNRDAGILDPASPASPSSSTSVVYSPGVSGGYSSVSVENMGYPTGSMARSRPKLPTMEQHGATLSPERLQRQDGSPGGGPVGGAGDVQEDLERDLNTLGSTDFISKYSRRKRASGTTSPAGSSRAMSPTHPGGERGPGGIRRIESLRLKLVKVKESQDRAERAGRELEKRQTPRRREGVVRGPSFGPLKDQRDSSNSAESLSTSSRNSPARDTTHGIPAGGLSPGDSLASSRVQTTTSVPMTPSVVADQHHQRAWSEPNFHSSRPTDDEDDDDSEVNIRYIQRKSGDTMGGGIQEGDNNNKAQSMSMSNSQTHHGVTSTAQPSSKKTLTFCTPTSSPEGDSPEESTLSETQSKNSSSSTLKDNFESEEDLSPRCQMSSAQPFEKDLEEMQLLGSSHKRRPPAISTKSSDVRHQHVIRTVSDPANSNVTNSGFTTHPLTPKSKRPEVCHLTSPDETREQSHRKETDLLAQLHSETSRSLPGCGVERKEGGRRVKGYEGVEGEEDEGVGHEESDSEERPGQTHIPTTMISMSLAEAPLGRGTDDSDDSSGCGGVGRGGRAGNGSQPVGVASGKLANGRYQTHPTGAERTTGRDLSSRSMDSNGLPSLHDASSSSSETAVPAPEEPSSQVSSGSVDSHIGSAEDAMGSTAEMSTYPDVVLHVMAEGNDVSDKFERRNGKSLKQKSKSDPSGDKRKVLQESQDLMSTIEGSHAQSASELDRCEQRESLQSTPSKLCSKQLEDAKSKSEQLLCTRGRRTGANLSKPDWSRPFIFKKSPNKDDSSGNKINSQHSSEDSPTRRASSTDSPMLTDSQTESNTAPSSPQTQSPTSTLDRLRVGRILDRSVSSASALAGGRGSVVQRPRDLGGRPKTRPPIQDVFLGGVYRPPSGADLSPPRGRGGGGGSLMHPNSGSTLSLMETPASEKEKRELIVEELVETERQYVETLQKLVDKYMIPLKTHGILDPHLVDDIFYKINEISSNHAYFLAFLEQALQRWDNRSSTIGDVIQSAFSRQTVIENYTSFIENFPRAEKCLDDLNNKSNFQKFLEQCEREARSKLPLKAQLVKPAQRIPRYELLLRRLIENTPRDHPDHNLLLGAEVAIHEVALRINSVKESKHEESLQETLRTLEFLLVTDLVAPERLYHRHDMVTVLSRKDQCCVWLFSDLAVLTCIKRKSGPVNRRSTLLLQSPSGQDFVENVKHKVWLKIPLDDLEIVKGATTHAQRQLVDREQLDDDLALLTQISDLASKLKGPHQSLDECIHELLSQVTKQLSEHQLKPPPPDTCRVQLMATTHEGVSNITIVFPSPEKKSSWESAFIEIKQKLATLSDGKPPEFLQALQITKTRAGMQFSCAAPIEGLNACQQRDVWVCNSDGYVGHMCLLSLQPEPIVTLNTPVPGCNARILCICAVPAFHGSKRKPSQARPTKMPTPSTSPVTIHVESFDGGADDGDDSLSDMSSSTSDQGSDDDDTLQIHPADKSSARSRSPSLTRSESGRDGGLLQDPYKSTMWLGTEDGCIHIFLCTDNIKTTKNKVKVQQNAAVLCIVHVDHKVFVSLDNGDLVVYRRRQDGVWDMSEPETLSVGSATSPVTKMLPVAGKLWCACQSNIVVLNLASLTQEYQFAVSVEPRRSVSCLAWSGQGVWVAGQSSSKVLLYHATTYEHLLEVSITQAVAHKLQTADDIIRQHKTACLRITALLTCKDLLWIGTSAGVVLTLVMPKVSAGTTRNSLTQPTVTGLVHGHTGHVRFLTSVEMPSSSSKRPSSAMDLGATGATSPTATSHLSRRASVSLHMLTMATRMLVISGGDGYEDFRSSSSNEAAGRDDSTNHLLLWQV